MLICSAQYMVSGAPKEEATAVMLLNLNLRTFINL